MKLSAKSFRYLAVLAPLALGLLAGGCGGLLGSLDGTKTPVPQGTSISVLGNTVFVAPGQTVDRSFNAISGTTSTFTVEGLPANSTVTHTIISQSPAGTITVTPIAGTNNATIRFNAPGTAVLQTIINTPGAAASTVNTTFLVSHQQGSGIGG